jgi:hypothetical protein
MWGAEYGVEFLPLLRSENGRGGRRMSIEIERGSLASKEYLRALIEKIGQTIIDRADDISCNPTYTKSILINANISTDEPVTISWEVETYTTPPVAYLYRDGARMDGKEE